MKKTHSKLVTVPPDWTWINLSIVFFLIVVPFSIMDVEATFPRIDSRLLLVIVFCTLIHASVYYSISREYLFVKVFGISVRKIAWSDFSGATYLCSRKSIRGNRRPNCILLSIQPAVPFQGSKAEELEEYKRHNRMRYVQLNIPDGQDTMYISIIEECLHKSINR